MIGRRLAHYEIVELLGKGGMAEVYRARDTRLLRDVALKILPPGFAEDPDRLKRFEREARAASALSHPHLAHIYDFGREDSVFYYAMEIIDGDTLTQRLHRGRVSLDELLRIGMQVSDALAALHKHQILHRDLKPGNILIDSRGDVKIVDFGLAKQAHLGGSCDDLTTELATEAGTVLGTLHYMSPEQARGETVDARSDLFSFGVILYELATGMKPFTGKAAVEVLTQLATFEPAPITQQRQDMPQELERIVRKCLHKDASMRYASADDLKVDLNNLRSPSLRRVSPSTTAPIKTRRRRWIPVTAVVGIAILSFLASLQWRSTSDAAIASVAVLPFANASESSDINYLCDGLAEGLINSLSQNVDLRVISRLSSFRFRDDTKDLEAIGKALGVEAVVVGHLTARGDQVSVSAELVDVRDSRQIWGGKYTQPNQEILALETQLAEAISQKLRPQTDLATQSRPQHRPAQDSEAYRLYLQASEYIVGSRTEMLKGIELLEKAIARRPDYALAYCALAEAHLKLALHGIEVESDALIAVKAALAHALEIDPDLAEAHSMLGSIAWNFDWNWTAAEQHHRRALELNPNSLTSNLRYAEYMTQAGRWREAIDISREAKKIDPLSTRATHWLGFSLLGNRQYEAAAAEFRSAIDLNPNWSWGYIKLSKALAHAGRLEEAVAAARTADQKFAGDASPLARSWIGGTYFMAGTDSLAQDSLEQLLRMSEQPGFSEAALAELYLTMGRIDDALELLEKAYENHHEDAAWLLSMPGLFMPELEDLPRFQRLVRLMGLDSPS
jgi:serine/threonine protein kinase/Flp pilus assembly protein TadD